MDIIQVETHQHDRYIPIQGLDSVEEALNTFARGITSSSRATEQHQVEAVGQSQGGFAAAFYVFSAPHMRESGNGFVQQHIMSDARVALQKGSKWSQHFDYDGQGSFFKTSVDINVLDRETDLYALGIHAAYVGGYEEGLADHLGVPRSLVWASVEVETMPINDNRFEFDFETILRRLDNVLNTNEVSGEEVIQVMMALNSYNESKASFVLSHKNQDVTVTLSPGVVDGRFDYGNRDNSNQPADTWEVEGSIMRGRLRESYEERGKMAAPTLVISLRSAYTDVYDGTLPIWDPEKKAFALELRDHIASALRS